MEHQAQRECHARARPTFDPATIREEAFARDRALVALRKHTEFNPTEALSLARAARIACLERKYFSAYFHARVGVRFKVWETYRRSRGARAQIVQSDRTIASIAAEWGFSGRRTLERAFRRFYGMTPHDLRREATIASR